MFESVPKMLLNLKVERDMKRGLRSPLQFRAPSNSGLQDAPFQPLNIIVCRRFEPSSIYKPPLSGHAPFTIFFPNPSPFLPPPLVKLFRQYRPNEMPDKHKNKLMRHIYSSIFRRPKNNAEYFFINNTFTSNIRLRFNPK